MISQSLMKTIVREMEDSLRSQQEIIFWRIRSLGLEKEFSTQRGKAALKTKIDVEVSSIFLGQNVSATLILLFHGKDFGKSSDFCQNAIFLDER